jgi:hypothetical protein
MAEFAARLLSGSRIIYLTPRQKGLRFPENEALNGFAAIKLLASYRSHRALLTFPKAAIDGPRQTVR